MVWKMTLPATIWASALWASSIPKKEAATSFAWSSRSRRSRSRACGAATVSTAALRLAASNISSLEASAALRRGGLLWRRAGPAADQQPTGEQREGEREQAEQTEPTRGPGAALLGQAVDHPCPALLTYGHRHHLPSTGPATASGGASTSHHAILLRGKGPRSTGTPLLVPRTPPGPGRTARPPLGGAGWCSCGLRWSGPARTPS